MEIVRLKPDCRTADKARPPLGECSLARPRNTIPVGAGHSARARGANRVAHKAVRRAVHGRRATASACPRRGHALVGSGNATATIADIATADRRRRWAVARPVAVNVRAPSYAPSAGRQTGRPWTTWNDAPRARLADEASALDGAWIVGLTHARFPAAHGYASAGHALVGVRARAPRWR